MQGNRHNNEETSSDRKPRAPGLVSAWISGVVVFTLSIGILLVVFITIGRTPWPTSHATPAGAGRFAWVFTDLLIVCLAYLAARSAFKSTLREEVRRREEMEYRRKEGIR